MKPRRKTLRKERPIAEIILWRHLKQQQLGYKFRRQHSIGHYVIDFYCPTLNLALEIDGDSHYVEDAPKLDSIRQQYIESFGIRFLRFTNQEIYKNLEKVLEVIRTNLP